VFLQCFRPISGLAQGLYEPVAGFQKTDFGATEKQLVLLTIGHENSCRYCTKAHSANTPLEAWLSG
jgi:alkylhydroperoxidase family enzyme